MATRRAAPEPPHDQTSTSLDEPWLRTSAGLQLAPDINPVLIVTTAIDNLVAELREVGHTV